MIPSSGYSGSTSVLIYLVSNVSIFSLHYFWYLWYLLLHCSIDTHGLARTIYVKVPSKRRRSLNQKMDNLLQANLLLQLVSFAL